MHRHISAVILGLIAIASLTAMGPAGEDRHCAALLVPSGPGAEPGANGTTEQDLGCYPTYAEALAAGSGGAITVPEDAAPATLTQSELDGATADAITSVLIGTEYTSTSYNGSSKSYFASETCSATVTWEVSYVGDAWNDDFESGKGFGSCDHNKKFTAKDFGGSILTCTPNCSDYGSFRNLISSLRWKD
ncbi:MAG: hypothetical protein ACJ77A_14920 [Actinomycetota bacterium]